MSIGPVGRGVPNFAPASLGAPGGGAAAFAKAGGSFASAFARDSFQPAAAAAPAAAGAAGSGGGMEQIAGALKQVVEALTKIVDMLKQFMGGGGAKPGGAPGGGGAPAGGAPAGGGTGQAAGPAGGGENANGPGGGEPTVAPGEKGGGDPTRGPTGESAIDVARSVLGKNASELKTNGRLAEEMEDWVPNNVNCANFVSACLEEAGQIPKGEHSASVAGLRANLEKDPHFQKTSIENAKPGDVVMMNTGDGDNGHVVIFAGMKNGKPTFIGSNNVNPDGSQKVTETGMNYKITGVYTYTG